RLGIQVRLDRRDVVGSLLPDPQLLLDIPAVQRLRDPRLLHDLRGPFQDCIRVFADEAVHVHARVELEDARLVVGVLTHLLEGGPPAVLRVLALVQTRLRVPSAEEHDSLRPLAAGRSDRPNVARERILMQVKEELFQRVRPAPGCADEFALWEEEVLGRGFPSVLASIPQAPLKGCNLVPPFENTRLAPGEKPPPARCKKAIMPRLSVAF